MQLSKDTPAQLIDIWQPRWKDRVVLIATFKVGMHNAITLSKTPSMKGQYYLSGEVIRNSPIDNNGKIPCYAVPMSKLQPLERI